MKPSDSSSGPEILLNTSFSSSLLLKPETVTTEAVIFFKDVEQTDKVTAVVPPDSQQERSDQTVEVGKATQTDGCFDFDSLKAEPSDFENETSLLAITRTSNKKYGTKKSFHRGPACES